MVKSMDSDPWASLTRQLGRIAGRRVIGDHPLSIFWAIDGRGRPGIVCNNIPNHEPHFELPALRGIEIERGKPDDSTLSLFLESREDREIFFALCRDIVDYSGTFPDSDGAYLHLLRRLSRWQAMLQRAHTKDLEEWQVRGLFGELWFLLDFLLPRIGIEAALLSWLGSSGAPKDFALPQSCVEVKTWLSGSRGHLHISSLEQLQPSPLPLFLLAIEVTACTAAMGGMNLNSLAREILKAAEDDSPSLARLASSALAQRGYAASDAYDDSRYLVVSQTAFSVNDDFPRFVRSAVDRRITAATYELDMSGLDAFRVPTDYLLEFKQTD